MDNESKDYLLTTIDNPYNPYTNYEEWEAYDRQQGYYTPEYIARVADTKNNFLDIETKASLAIDEILFYNFLKIYKKVYPPK